MCFMGYLSLWAQATEMKCVLTSSGGVGSVGGDNGNFIRTAPLFDERSLQSAVREEEEKRSTRLGGGEEETKEI